MYILDTMPDFVKILGYGLSGFAFLLMFFAYMLLRQVINKENAGKMIFKSIWAFMGLSFLLTIAVGVFSYITGDYKEKTITKQQNSLELIRNDQSLEKLVSSVETGNVTDVAQFDRLKTEQQGILAEQESKLDKSDATKEEKSKFAGLKSENIKTLDSLKRPDIPAAKKEELRNKYLVQTKELSKISSEVVKRQTSSTASRSMIRPQ